MLTRDAVVASTSSSSNLRLWSNKGCLGLGEGALWCNGLSGAVNNLSVLDETLDQPVILASTNDATTNTALAEIKISIIADAAMIVNIWNRVIAVIAIDRINADSWAVGLCHSLSPEILLVIV